MSVEFISFQERVERAGFEIYAAYLLSDHWQQLRVRCRKRKHWRCFACRTPGRLDLHHVTYERLGDEQLGDMVLLCRRCHAATHELARNGVALEVAHLLVRRERAERAAARRAQRRAVRHAQRQGVGAGALTQ